MLSAGCASRDNKGVFKRLLIIHSFPVMCVTQHSCVCATGKHCRLFTRSKNRRPLLTTIIQGQKETKKQLSGKLYSIMLCQNREPWVYIYIWRNAIYSILAHPLSPNLTAVPAIQCCFIARYCVIIHYKYIVYVLLFNVLKYLSWKIIFDLLKKYGYIYH